MILKTKICILIYLILIVACSTVKENQHLIVGNVIDDILNNPQKLYQLYKFYLELRCDESNYNLTKDSAKLIEVIENINKLKSDTDNIQIGAILEDSSWVIYVNKNYFNSNYIKDKDEIVKISFKKKKFGVNFFFLFKESKYYLFDISVIRFGYL